MHYNLINESMHARKSVTEVFVGLCGTEFCGTDRWPMVITEVISPKKVRVCFMHDEDYNKNRLINEDKNEYLSLDIIHNKYSKLNMEGKSVYMGDVYTYRKNHRWIKTGHNLWETGALHFGKADEYRDPCF